MKRVAILHLEDSPIDADLVSSKLSAGGIQHDIRRVEREDEFRLAIEQQSFDIILADYALPEFDGVTALDFAKKICPDTPFVFVSGAIGEEVAIESLHRGATDYVLKQRLARLVPAVTRALAEARERRARRGAEAERERLLERERAAREQAEDHARRLSQANEELEQFAFAASHDLQEPLRIVKIYAELVALRYKDKLDEEGKGFLNTIEMGVEKMERLISDFLAYSRMAHDREASFRPLDLNAIVQNLLEEFSNQIDENRATVMVGSLPQVEGDLERITSLFRNLISNSLKYRDSLAPHIRIGSELREGSWVVWVKDNGIGFDQIYARKIFHLFKRLHRSEYPGTGVGLAMAKKIVEQHGGEIWAEGELGQGASFYFTLRSTDRRNAGCTKRSSGPEQSVDEETGLDGSPAQSARAADFRAPSPEPFPQVS